ncbi:MAG: PAS domain S-box protein [Trichocoleus desertorum ATA4-8-CV12]|jgi:PAS domain S-box-containing protein|nr:PAS domain S-box protein [Trichocoleus desertorum ATA4-8-CV12]
MQGPNQPLDQSCCCSTHCCRSDSRGQGDPQAIAGTKQAQQQSPQDQRELEAKVAERTAELTRMNQQLQQEILQHQTTVTALQESHSLLRNVIDHIPDHVFAKDVAGRFVLVNATLANSLAQPPEALLGKQSDEIFAAEVATRFRAKDLHVISTGVSETFEELFSSPTGLLTTRLTTKLPWRNANDEIIGIIGIARDISSRIHTETALRESEERYRQLVELCPDAIFIQRDGKFVFLNPAAVELYGGTCTEDLIGTSVLERVHPDYQALVQARMQQLQQSKTPAPLMEQKLCRLDGTMVDAEVTAIPLTYQGEPAIQVVLRDITERQRVEAVLRDSEAQLKLDIIEGQQAEELLRQQSQRDRLIADVVQQIRQSLHLDTILSTTVKNIRQCLESDRVTLYRLDGNSRGRFIAESVAPEWPSLLRTTMRQSWLKHYLDHYHQGLVSVFVDVQQAFSPGMERFLQRYQVQAGLAVPILQGQKLWGLLMVHQCSTSRDWQVYEIDLLQQLAAQVAIAIQQSELFRQVQQLNTVLEDQVQERTAQLAQALDFEARLKRITDKVRDSLDEDHILTTAVQELALGLEVRCCDTGIYNAAHTTSTITHEYSDSLSAIGRTIAMADRPEIYQQLLQGQYLQFCISDSLTIRSAQGSSTMLACPILDDQGVLGDLSLFRPDHSIFNELEIRLVQQVANQCAIAIRQARLYQAAQAQVAELEKLNRLKDDFLSTISHELRTPMASIKMAAQMLEMTLMQEEKLAPSSSDRASQYFQVLHDECDREIKLINDLLDLTRLDAETEPLLFTAINPYCWIPSVVEPFLEQARMQEQELQVHLPPGLPTLHTDLSILERILTELLRNACKYTPTQAAIAVTAQANSEFFRLTVHNSGVEIAAVELEHVFDKFYRIPNHDPWKHGGTGLGLALVRKLVEHLSGTIQATSEANQVSFTVQIPIAPPALT